MEVKRKFVLMVVCKRDKETKQEKEGWCVCVWEKAEFFANFFYIHIGKKKKSMYENYSHTRKSKFIFKSI